MSIDMQRFVSLVQTARKADIWRHILSGVIGGDALVILDQNLCGRSSYTLDPAIGLVGDAVMLLADYESLPAVIEMGSLVTPHLNFTHVEYVLECQQFDVAAILNDKACCRDLLGLLQH